MVAPALWDDLPLEWLALILEAIRKGSEQSVKTWLFPQAFGQDDWSSHLEARKESEA